MSPENWLALVAVAALIVIFMGIYAIHVDGEGDDDEPR